MPFGLFRSKRAATPTAGVSPLTESVAEAMVAPEKRSPEREQLLEKVRFLKQSGRLAEAAQLLDTEFKRQSHPVVGYRLIATLLDLKRYAEITQLTAAQAFNSRDFALAAQLLDDAPTRLATLCLSGHEPLEHCAYVSMVKDEQDIVLLNLVWHYMLGFRRFLLLDNLSTDATADLIEAFRQRFSDATVLVLKDTVVAHFQGRKMSGAVSYLKALWPELEWVALVDADEFLCAEQPLHQMLSAAPPHIQGLMLPKSIYRPTSLDQLTDASDFHRRVTRRQLLSHVSTKMMVRAEIGLNIAQGNHRFLETKGYTTANYGAVQGLTMREFPLRSFAQFEKKVASGHRAIEAAKDQGLKAVGGDHWVNMSRVLTQQGSDGLIQHVTGQMAGYAKQPFLEDPLPLDTVMEKHWPDWRSALPQPAG
ncbi:MAG: hypothetical protein C4K60_10855 [Ideonella sp. MAG2]|nr:MAG: hypothetical protein C4K60_10855 [Ideonella sp. MAG2]